MKIKNILMAFAAVVAISYGISWYHCHPKINDEAVQFFIKNKKRIPDSENVAYAFIGFRAPKDIVDIHKFGLDLFNQVLAKYLTADGKHIMRDAELPDIEDELIFNADTKKLMCWIGKKSTENTQNGEYANDESCYTAEELIEVIKSNSILLERHEQLKKYKKFDNDNALLLKTKPQIIMDTHKLFLANIKYSLEKGDKEAFELLIDDVIFFKNLSSQPSALLDKMINLTMYSHSLRQLDFAVNKYTNIAIEYKKEIDNALVSLTTKDLNIEGIFTEEFETLNGILCIDDKLGITTPDYCCANSIINPSSINYVVNDLYERYLSYSTLLNTELIDATIKCYSRYYPEPSEEKIFLDTLIHLPIWRTNLARISIGLYGLEHRMCDLIRIYASKSDQQIEIKAYLDSNTPKQ